MQSRRTVDIMYQRREGGSKMSSLSSLKGVTDAAEESTVVACIAVCRAGRVLARRACGTSSPVSCSTSPNMPHGTVLHELLSGTLTLEFFIEGEDSTFGTVVDVSCSTSAAAKLGAGFWESGFEV